MGFDLSKRLAFHRVTQNVTGGIEMQAGNE